MWITHLAIKKEERNGYGSGTSLWNKLHIQVSLWFYYMCRLLCSRNILREFILWIGVFAFCFILFNFSPFFSTKMIKKFPFYGICKFLFWFDFDFFSSFLSVLVCFVFSLKDYFSYFLMEKNFCGWIWLKFLQLKWISA